MSATTAKQKVDPNSPAVRAAMAKGEALWRLIIEAGFGTPTALKIRDREPFDTMSTIEQLMVVKIATFMQRTAAEIDDQYAPQIEAHKAGVTPPEIQQPPTPTEPLTEEIEDEQTAEPEEESPSPAPAA
jgi:hypothetical protein